MKYINLLGEEIDTDEVRAKLRKLNPMVKIYGPGPSNYRCKDCTHLYAKQFANRYFKCDLRRNTNGPATDHRANWPTCGKFNHNFLPNESRL